MNLTFDRSNFECVTTQLQFNQWMNRCRAAKSICFDTETTGLDTFNDDLVGLAFGVQDGDRVEACYVPIAHQKHLGKTLSWHDVKVQTRDLLQSGKPIVMANALFDMLIMRQPRYATKIENVHDTQLMSYALTGNLHFQHGMDALAERIMNYTPIKFKDIVNEKLGVLDFSYVRLDTATTYSAEDAAVTLVIAKALQQQLKAEGLWELYDKIDRPLLPVLVDMKLSGVLVDYKHLAKVGAEFTKEMKPLEKLAHKQAGRVFNLRSSAQVASVLYDPVSEGGLGVKVPGYTKGGSPSADKDTLEQIHGVPVIDTILDWKQYAFLVSNLCEGLPEKRNPLTNRVHTNHKITSTKTRRLSSADPALQNIPVRTEEGALIREAFISDKGNVLISADYSQIEYRVLAHVSKDAYLIDAFLNGIDLHAKMAADVRGGTWEQYADKKDKARSAVRSAFKNVNFATVYGAGPAKVARMSKIELAEAYSLLAAHREMCPGVYGWKEETWEFASKWRYVENLFGGRTHVTYINSTDRELKGHAERLAINAPIQGGAAELIRLAMPRVHAAIGTKARLLLQVHDELVLECRKESASDVAAKVKTEMETCADAWIDWRVPIVAETGKPGKNWRLAK